MLLIRPSWFILATDLQHESEPMNLTPNRFERIRTAVYKAPQTAKEGNKTLPHCSAGVTHFSTLKHSRDVNVSMCHTSTDSSESRLWSSGGIHEIYHAESRFDACGMRSYHHIPPCSQLWNFCVLSSVYSQNDQCNSCIHESEHFFTDQHR